MSTKQIFDGLTFSFDRFATMPRCFGAFIKEITGTDTLAGCTLSAFWYGLGFEPVRAKNQLNKSEDRFAHPDGRRFDITALQSATTDLADAHGLGDFCNRIITPHDSTNTATGKAADHEHFAMQLIYALVDKADMIDPNEKRGHAPVEGTQSETVKALNKLLI